MSFIFGLFAIGIGLAVAFRGLSLFRVLLPFWAFFVGLWAGAAGIAALFGGSLFASVLGLGVGFVLGLIFAAVSYFAFAFAVVLFGASIGFALGQGFMGLFNMDGGFLAFLLAVSLAVVFAIGFIGFRMPRFVVIVASGFAGAMAALTGLFVMFGALSINAVQVGAGSVAVRNSAFWTFVWIVLAFAGMIAQYKEEKKKELLFQAFVVEQLPQ